MMDDDGDVCNASAAALSLATTQTAAVNLPKKTLGRRKVDIRPIEVKSKRHITFSKRKSGLLKKAYELSALTNSQVMVLITSETGGTFGFATDRLLPLFTSAEGQNVLTSCLGIDPENFTPKVETSATYSISVQDPPLDAISPVSMEDQFSHSARNRPLLSASRHACFSSSKPLLAPGFLSSSSSHSPAITIGQFAPSPALIDFNKHQKHLQSRTMSASSSPHLNSLLGEQQQQTASRSDCMLQQYPSENPFPNHDTHFTIQQQQQSSTISLANYVPHPQQQQDSAVIYTEQQHHQQHQHHHQYQQHHQLGVLAAMRQRLVPATYATIPTASMITNAMTTSAESLDLSAAWRHHSHQQHNRTPNAFSDTITPVFSSISPPSTNNVQSSPALSSLSRSRQQLQHDLQQQLCTQDQLLRYGNSPIYSIQHQQQQQHSSQSHAPFLSVNTDRSHGGSSTELLAMENNSVLRSSPINTTNATTTTITSTSTGDINCQSRYLMMNNNNISLNDNTFPRQQQQEISMDYSNFTTTSVSTSNYTSIPILSTMQCNDRSIQQPQHQSQQYYHRVLQSSLTEPTKTTAMQTPGEQRLSSLVDASLQDPLS